MRRRVLFVSHESDVLPGYLGDAAERHGMAVDVCDLWAGDTLGDPRRHDLIVPLGSAASAYDDTVPWLADELAYLRRAAELDRAVFGVCFGAQALARALGGAVGPAVMPEIGWYTVRTVDPLLIEPGPWLEWHFDAIEPPAGARVLAESPAGIQAWHRDRQLGVQFHPEVTPGILDAWITSSTTDLARAGVDVDTLRSETRDRVDHATASALRLFDRVLDVLGVRSSA